MSSFVSPTTRRPLSRQICLDGDTVNLNAVGEVDSSAGVVTVYAPFSAGVGSCFAVFDAGGQAGTNAITIDANGSTIDGSASDSLATGGGARMYVRDQAGWVRSAVTREIGGSYVSADEAGGPGGDATVAQDVARSGGGAGPIDRVQGIRGRAIQNVVPPVGGTVIRNLVGGDGFKFGKPAHHGAYRPEDYGAVGDGVTDDSAAFATMLSAINADDALDYRGASIILGERKTYYLADSLFLDRQVRLTGQGGGSFATVATTQIKFAAGKGIWLRVRGGDRARASGSQVKDLEIICQPVPGILEYAHATAYAVGQLMRFLHDREFVWECVKAGTTATALVASGAVAEWQASTAIALGEIRVPTPAQQNGHKYRCVQAGVTAAVEPDIPLYGWWPWRGGDRVTDGSVIWEEAGIYQPHHGYNCIRSFTDMQSPDVVWTAGREYEGNAIVRVVGDAAEFTKFLFNGQGSRGVSGGAAPSLAGAIGDTVVDGGITWTIIDPVFYGLVLTDGSAIFMPRCHPCIDFAAPGCVIDRVRMYGASGDAVHILSSSFPPSNVNHWNVRDCSIDVCAGGGINVRGSDSNGGLAIGNTTGGGWPILQADGVEANYSFRDHSLGGCTWVGNRNGEGVHGYAFDGASETGLAAWFGGYAEGGPVRMNSQSVTVGMTGSAAPAITPDSNGFAPNLGRGVFGREPKSDGTHNLLCKLAGYRGHRHVVSGYLALAVQAEEGSVAGEVEATGACFEPAGWDTGWWGWSFGPHVYGGIFSAFAWTGDLAGPRAGITSAGQMTIPRKRLGFGHPDTGTGAPFVLGFCAGLPSAIEPGTWKVGDVLFEEAAAPNASAGRRCVVAGIPGTWDTFGWEFRGRVTIPMGDDAVVLTAAQARVASLKLTGANTAARLCTFPAPASESEVMLRAVEVATTGFGAILTCGVGTDLPMGPGTKALVQISSDGVQAMASYSVS